jgi:hypothetical protein
MGVSDQSHRISFKKLNQTNSFLPLKTSMKSIILLILLKKKHKQTTADNTNIV